MGRSSAERRLGCGCRASLPPGQEPLLHATGGLQVEQLLAAIRTHLQFEIRNLGRPAPDSSFDRHRLAAHPSPPAHWTSSNSHTHLSFHRSLGGDQDVIDFLTRFPVEFSLCVHQDAIIREALNHVKSFGRPAPCRSTRAKDFRDSLGVEDGFQHISPGKIIAKHLEFGLECESDPPRENTTLDALQDLDQGAPLSILEVGRVVPPAWQSADLMPASAPVLVTDEIRRETKNGT